MSYVKILHRVHRVGWVTEEHLAPETLATFPISSLPGHMEEEKREGTGHWLIQVDLENGH